jgi:hypothetical protein
MQMGKDRISGEADAAQELPQFDVISAFHDHAAGLHMYKQAVLAILVINQDPVPDVFRVLASRKFWMSDLRCPGIFKPVVRDVIRSR